MKIIFETDGQKSNFFKEICPSMCRLNDHKDCSLGKNIRCDDCWEQSGLNYEIQNEETVDMNSLKEYYKQPFIDFVYNIVKMETKDLDSVYEDYIINLVGVKGLNALIENKLVEGCGIVNCRKLYVLLDKKN